MNTKYNYDKFQSLGFEIEYKRKKSVKFICKKIYKFANKNYVTTFSNWLSFGIGFIGLVIMVVL